MPVDLQVFARHDYVSSEEFVDVQRIAEQLLDSLREPLVAAAIDAANQPGQSSGEVQNCFGDAASRLGFRSEHRGLFASYQSGLRPDYYLALGATGIILEVERGKTTANNMDILDFWKVHLCPSAHYLFLVVPKALKHNNDMRPVNQHAIVGRRLKNFFAEPRNYTNVRALFLFGY